MIVMDIVRVLLVWIYEKRLLFCLKECSFYDRFMESVGEKTMISMIKVRFKAEFRGKSKYYYMLKSTFITKVIKNGVFFASTKRLHPKGGLKQPLPTIYISVLVGFRWGFWVVDICECSEHIGRIAF